jgi:hypothetical protein
VPWRTPLLAVIIGVTRPEEPCGHCQAAGCWSRNAAGQGDREAVIIEVWSEYGRPPYVVRWRDGSQNVFFPAPADTLIAGDSHR